MVFPGNVLHVYPLDYYCLIAHTIVSTYTIVAVCWESCNVVTVLITVTMHLRVRVLGYRIGISEAQEITNKHVHVHVLHH